LTLDCLPVSYEPIILPDAGLATRVFPDVRHRLGVGGFAGVHRCMLTPSKMPYRILLM
jgi:hypothetical protein